MKKAAEFCRLTELLSILRRAQGSIAREVSRKADIHCEDSFCFALRVEAVILAKGKNNRHKPAGAPPKA